jgi:hypothetical protein
MSKIHQVHSPSLSDVNQVDSVGAGLVEVGVHVNLENRARQEPFYA